MTYYIEFETNFGATFCYTNVTRITISGGGVKIEGFDNDLHPYICHVENNLYTKMTIKKGDAL